MQAKISKTMVIFILICGVLSFDLWQKNEKYKHFLVLKKIYLKRKKSNKKPKKESQENLDWPNLLKIWNQKAHELNCQIKKIKSNNLNLGTYEYQIKVSGQFFDLIKWLKATHELMPQIFWTKIMITIKANHQLQLLVEGGQYV